MALKNIIFPDRAIMQGGTWLFLERLIFIAKGFLLSLLYANLLPKEVFGQFQFVVSVLSIATVTALPGMGTAIVQGVARSHDGNYYQGVSKMLLWSLSGSAIIFLFSLKFLLTTALENFVLLSLGAIVFPLFAISGTWRYYYTGKELYAPMAKISFLIELATLIPLALVVFVYPNATALTLTYLLGIIGTTVGLNYSLLRKTKLERFDGETITYGKRLSFSAGINTIAGQYDKIFVGQFLGFAQLASYNIAGIIPDQIKGAVVSYMVPYLPRFSRGAHHAELWKIFVRFLLACVGLTGVYIVAVPYVFHVFFPVYIDTILIAQLIGIGIILSIPFVIIETYFRSQKADKIVLYHTILGVLSTLIGIAIVAPAYGVLGVVFAKMASYFLQGVFLLSALTLKLRQ